MKFQELLEKAETGGSYVCGKFAQDTVDSIVAFQALHHIPNAVEAEELHTTIVYSKTTVHWRAAHDIYHEAAPIGFEVWKTQSEKNCLVLKIECPYLNIRFGVAMDRGATYDFDEYKPHITLSYDVGDDFGVEDLPTPDFDIVIDREEYSPLNPDYAS
jgi:hypothetical protein